MTTLIIDDLVNDLNKKTLGCHTKWEGDPEKHLELAVPFDHTFENLRGVGHGREGCPMVGARI